MKLVLMPKEPTWWVWLITTIMLASGLAGVAPAFVAAILLSVAQTGYFLPRDRSWTSWPVQIVLGYTALLLVYLWPPLRWLICLPQVGTYALVLVGYCLMARLLSLLPWNRFEPLTQDLLHRTFLSPPVVGKVGHGLPGCSGGGVCELKTRVAWQRPEPVGPKSTSMS